MQLMKVDPRALLENPDRSRHTPSTPQADALNRRAGSSSLDVSVSCEIDNVQALVRDQHRQLRTDPEGGRKTPL